MPALNGLAQQLAELNEAATDPAPPKPPRAVPKRAQPADKPHQADRPAETSAWKRQAKARQEGKKVHLGAWLSEDYRRGVLMVRAKTGEDVQELFARLLDSEFAAHGISAMK